VCPYKKIRKITNSSAFISLRGAVMCLVSAGILISYNLVHNPKALQSSAWVVVLVVMITFIYHKLGSRMKKVLDELKRRIKLIC